MFEIASCQATNFTFDFRWRGFTGGFIPHRSEKAQGGSYVFTMNIHSDVVFSPGREGVSVCAVKVGSDPVAPGPLYRGEAVGQLCREAEDVFLC